MHILLVDDDTESCLALAELLKAEGYSVNTASDGHEALEVVKSEKFDAIISDALMPRMDGFVLCRTLKADDTYRHIPVIILTGEYTDKSDAQFAMSVGASEVVRKTGNTDRLLAALSKLSQGSPGNKISDSSEEMGHRNRTLPEEEYLKGYSTVLVRRLEAKMVELEEVNRKLIERNVQLEHERKKYRQLFVSANDGLLLVSQGTGAVAESNVHARRILKLSEKNLSEMKLEDLKPFGELLLKKISRGEPVQFEGSYEAEGSKIFLDISGASTGTEDNLYLIILKNITRRKEWLERFIALDKLRALGRLSQGLVHEIGNPLNVISVNLQFLDRSLDENSPERKFAKSALAGVKAIENVMRETMNFAQPQIPAKSNLNLGMLLSEIAGLARASLQRSKVSIEIQQVATDDVVFADKSQLLHAILNIVDNSIEAMPNGGRLLFKLENSVIGRELVLKISDTGTGMDEDAVKLAIEPFYTTKHGATGMGLSISNRLLELNDASLGFEADPAAGTTVVVRFQRER